MWEKGQMSTVDLGHYRSWGEAESTRRTAEIKGGPRADKSKHTMLCVCGESNLA